MRQVLLRALKIEFWDLFNFCFVLVSPQITVSQYIPKETKVTRLFTIPWVGDGGRGRGRRMKGKEGWAMQVAV